jgi:hypothetical protein
MMHDLPVLLLKRVGYKGEPGVATPDSRVLQTPESTANASYNNAKRRKEANIRAEFDTLGRPSIGALGNHADDVNQGRVKQLAKVVYQNISNGVTPNYLVRTPARLPSRERMAVSGVSPVRLGGRSENVP